MPEVFMRVPRNDTTSRPGQQCAFDNRTGSGSLTPMQRFLTPRLLALSLCALLGLLPGSLAVAADAPAEFSAGTLTFTRPTAWRWVPSTSSVRSAELKVEGKGGAADVVFFHFGAGQGGDTKANVERWYGQFSDGRDKINARSEEKTVNGRKITYVNAEGTYLSGPPMGQKTPLKDHALVGAILEDAGGNVFIRLTGPKELAKAAEPEFRKMVESAKK